MQRRSVKHYNDFTHSVGVVVLVIAGASFVILKFLRRSKGSTATGTEFASAVPIPDPNLPIGKYEYEGSTSVGSKIPTVEMFSSGLVDGDLGYQFREPCNLQNIN